MKPIPYSDSISLKVCAAKNRQESPRLPCQILPESLSHLLRKSNQFHLMLTHIPHRNYFDTVLSNLKREKTITSSQLLMNTSPILWY